MRPLFLLSLCVLTACAGTKTAAPPPPAPAPIEKKVFVTRPPEPQPPQAPPAEEEDLDEVDLGRSSDLRVAISRWIAENPDAEYEVAARMANRFLRRHGYPMMLDVAKLLKPGQDRIRIRSGKRTFTFHAGEELSRTPDICGERFLRIPGKILGPNQAALVAEGRAFPFSLKGFRRERFRVLKKGKPVATLYAPEPTEPIGLASNGKSIFIKFSLDERRTAQWWQKITRNQPSLLDEDPYLSLRVERGRLYFNENQEHLPPQDFEVEHGDGSVFRWRFRPSGLVLELNSLCA